MPIVPNIGMFASFDPVALDQACADAVLAAPVMPGSALDKPRKEGVDYFTALFPETNWQIQLEHARKLGLGTRQYELIKI